MDIPVKLIMSWDIAPDREQEYFEFVIREYLPGMQRLGFELSDAWATVYGNKPQIQVAAILPSQGRLSKILRSEEWQRLNNQLQDFVRNFTQKVVKARGGFQF